MTTAAISSSAQVRVAHFEDYPQIQRLESSHGLGTLPDAAWRSLWLDNPLWPRLGEDWPIGWVLEDVDGQVVGSLTNIPSLYKYRGRDLICANGRGWVVAPQHRGLALWLFAEYFNQDNADLFINTTVNALSASKFGQLSARIPLGDWETAAYFVTGYRGFARSALKFMNVPLANVLAYPAAAVLYLKDAFKSAPRGLADIAMPDEFDSRFDAFWSELVEQNPDKLLGVRDSQTLAWHFAIAARAGQIRIFTASRAELLRGYCILKRQDAPHGLARMRLVDYQSVEDDLLPDLLQAALRQCAAEGIHVLEHLGCGVPRMRSFDRFAPYRRKLESWPFYYQAADVTLHAELSKPDAWDPSAYDGDASID